MLGSALTMVAIPYQSYLLSHHNNFVVGLVSALGLPTLVGGALVGGAVGDRVDRRRIVTRSALALALVSVGLGVNSLSGSPSLIVLATLSIIAAGLGGFIGPARSAAIPQLVAPDQLVAAYAINQIVIQVGAVVGPALSGVLLAGTGLSTCYLIDAASFLVLALLSAQLRPLLPAGSPPGLPLRRAIRDGFSYLRTHRLAQSVYLVDLNAMIFGSPRALYPAMALSVYHGGTVTLGWLNAAPGMGALIGAVTSGWVARVTRRGRMVVLAVMTWGLAVTLFGLSSVAVVGVVALALAGYADVISAVLRNTILQSSISDDFRSRLSSIQIAVVTGGPRLGDLEGGVVAHEFRTVTSVVSGGLLATAGAVALGLWRPELWRDRVTES
jgi:MFS family permease